jgi:hypothetical protein
LGHLSKLATKRLVISDEGFAHGAGGSAFSREEMLAIRDCMSDVWVNDSVIPMTREGRHLSRALISLMSSTGITPGLEVETLTQSQIEFRRTPTSDRRCVWQSTRTRASALMTGSSGRVITMSRRC